MTDTTSRPAPQESGPATGEQNSRMNSNLQANQLLNQATCYPPTHQPEVSPQWHIRSDRIKSLRGALFPLFSPFVSRFGLAVSVRLVSGRTSVRYRFGSPFSPIRLWFVDTVLWLCPSLPTETLKRLSSLPIFMQKSFWW